MKDIEVTLLSRIEFSRVIDIQKDGEKINFVIDKSVLPVIEKYGLIKNITDLVTILGCYEYLCTRTVYYNGAMVGISLINGSSVKLIKTAYNYGICPVLDIKDPDLFKEITKKRYLNEKNCDEVLYGEYPQYAAPEEIQEQLENNYNNGLLTKTGKSYTFDAINRNNPYDTKEPDFVPLEHPEYKYYGKKYVRVQIKDSAPILLINKEISDKYNQGDYIWIEVTPIKWLIEDETKQLISPKALLSGIKYSKNYENESFENTTMYKYLNEYMLKDMLNVSERTFTKEEAKISDTAISNIKSDINTGDLSEEEKELLEAALAQVKTEKEAKEVASLRRDVKDLLDKLSEESQSNSSRKK